MLVVKAVLGDGVHCFDGCWSGLKGNWIRWYSCEVFSGFYEMGSGGFSG